MANFGYTGSLKTVIDGLIIGAKQRANHTGTQSADTLVDGVTVKAYTTAERAKLDGVAAGATVNRADAATDVLLAGKETAGAAAAAQAAAVQRGNHTGTQPTSTVAGLDAALTGKADLVGGVVPTSQIPAIALTNGVTVPSRAALLALTSAQVQPGDVAVDTSAGATRGSYLLSGSDPSQLASWVLLNAPQDVVSSVNGQTGTVVLAKADIGLGNVANTAPADLPVSTAAQAAVEAVTLTGAPATLTASGTATIGATTLLNAASGSLTVTLPAPSKVGQLIVLERIDPSTVNTVTVSGTLRGVATTAAFAQTGVAGETLLYRAESLTSWRPIASHRPRALLDAMYTPAGTAAAAPNVQVFDTAGTYTWTKPAGVTVVQVRLVGGGAGGGSGRRGAAGTVRCGGGTGIGGSRTLISLPAALLPATVQVTVGAGGSGGAAVTTDDTNGNAGAGGGQSLFGAYARAGHGSNGGQGGTSTGGAAGVSGGMGGGNDGAAAGTAASTTGGAGSAGTVNTADGNSGSGSGGGITAANVPGNGGAGAAATSVSTAGSAGGVVDGALPDSGAAAFTTGRAARGVGGGAASITQAAQAGADGPANSGVAGGGGGASLNGFASGRGGNGGSGLVVVTSW